MKAINPYFLNVPLDPFCGMADVDEEVERFRDFNSNDEEAVRRLIQEQMKPYVAELHLETRDRISDAYRYYLSRKETNFDRVFGSVLAPFDPPDNPRDMFLWIWQECFGGDYAIDDSVDYRIVANFNEVGVATWRKREEER